MSKKISFAALALIFSLFSTQVFALDLDKIASAVNGGNQKDGSKKSGSVLDGALGGVTNKLQDKINQITDKLDKYQAKIDKAEKATDKITDMVNNFDLEKYIGMVKIGLFVLAGAFAFFGIMLVLVFVQILSLKKKLMSAAIKF